MTDPIKYNSTSSEPVSNPEEDYQYPDPYSDIGGYAGDDWTGGDFGEISGGGDAFIGGDEPPGGSSAPADMSPNGLRYWLDDLRKQGAISEAQFNAWTAEVNGASGIRDPGQQAAAFDKIIGEVNNFLYPPPPPEVPEGEDPLGLGDALNEGDTTKSLDEVKTELNTLKTDIQNSTNLTEDERVQLSARVETLLNDIDLHPENADPESIKSEIEDIRSQLEEANKYSPALKGLAEAAGMEIEVLKAKAEAAGINLENLSVPPSMNLMNFLIENIPDLKTKAEAVGDAINERTSFYETVSRTCTDINSSNSQCTSDGDQSIAPFQDLFDLKYHQDDKSKAVKNAMDAFTGALTPILEALYPGKEVKPIEVTGVSGWERTDQEYQNADKLTIGGTIIDLFNNTDGSLQSSTAADTEPEISIPSIARDEEGAGNKEGTGNQGLSTYGSSITWDSYDSDDG